MALCMSKVVEMDYVIEYFTIFLDNFCEVSVSSWWIFFKAIGKPSKVMIVLLCWCCPVNDIVIKLKYVWCWYAYILGYKYVRCGIMVIMQVDDVCLEFLTQYVYDILILQMKGCDENKFSSKPKELMILYIQRVNILCPMISFKINGNLKVTQKGTLA